MQTRELEWMHAVQSENFTHAALCLSQIAEEEKQNVQQRKTKYSLAKLCYIYNRGGDQNTSLQQTNQKLLEITNLKLHFINAQEKLSDLGFGKIEKPLTPEELIQLCCRVQPIKNEKDQQNVETRILIALEVFNNLVQLHEIEGDYDEQKMHYLLVHIWMAAWSFSINLHELAINWSKTQPSDDVIQQEIHNSVIYKAAVRYIGTPAMLTEEVFNEVKEISKQNKQLVENSKLLEILNSVWELLITELEENVEE